MTDIRISTEVDEPETHSFDRNIWAAVMTKALNDLHLPSDDINNSAWFFSMTSENFLIACHALDLDPSFVINTVETKTIPYIRHGVCKSTSALKKSQRPPCSVEGCEEPIHSKVLGYCSKHRARFRAHGSPYIYKKQNGQTIDESEGL
jgi:hypothetical protein